MIYLLKNNFKKIKVYYFYFLKKQSRQYFFILIKRKFFNLFSNSDKKKLQNSFIENWCYKKKAKDKNFYRNIGILKIRNFFNEQRNYYNSAKLKEKKLKYKMGGMAHLNLIYNLILYLKPKSILETGVAFGWSTLVLVLSKPKISELISIDLSYPTASSEKFVALALPYSQKKKLKLLRGIDSNFLKLFYEKNKRFDFIHYDSDKSYEGRKKNYDLIWKILNKKGCFVSDDISDNPAFYEFVKNKKIKYFILKLNYKYIGIVFK